MEENKGHMTQREKAAAINAEFERLGGAIPYGLCYQIPLKQLQSMTIEAARKWHSNWKAGGVCSKVPAVADVLATMHSHGMTQEQAVEFLKKSHD